MKTKTIEKLITIVDEIATQQYGISSLNYGKCKEVISKLLREKQRKEQKKEGKANTVTFKTHLDLDTIFNDGYNKGYKASKSDYTNVLNKLARYVKELSDRINHRSIGNPDEMFGAIDNLISNELKNEGKKIDDSIFEIADSLKYVFDRTKTPSKFYSFETGIIDGFYIGKIIRIKIKLVDVIGKVISQEKKGNRLKWEVEEVTELTELKPLDIVLNCVLESDIKELNKTSYKILEKENIELNKRVDMLSKANIDLQDRRDIQTNRLKDALTEHDYLFNSEMRLLPSIPNQRFSLKQVNEIIAKFKASGCCQIIIDNAIKKAKTDEVTVDMYMSLQLKNEKLSEGYNILQDKISAYEKKENDIQNGLKEIFVAYNKFKEEYDIKPKSKKKIDIFNPSNWFIKDESIEDKIKEAKTEYDRLIDETPIGKLSVRQIQDHLNLIVKNYKDGK